MSTMIFSVTYMIVAGFSLTMGFHVMRMYAKGVINRLFFVLSVCIMLWSLGFSVTIIAPNAALAAFWTRISAVGYSLFYSVFLHFTLALTGNLKTRRIKWFLPLIYVPAALELFALVISPDITSSLYKFVYTSIGWTRYTEQSIYDIIYQVYFISFVLISLVLIWLWRRRSVEQDVKKQGLIFLASITSVIVLGAVTDIANGMFFNISIPKMAPILFLIPLVSIFYCINRYHLMSAPTPHKSELILNEEYRKPVFGFVSLLMILEGIVMPLMDIIFWKMVNPVYVVLAGVFPIVTGIVMYLVQYFNKPIKYLEWLLIFCTLIILPVLMSNMSAYGGVTVWALPIITIVCSLMFNMRLVLFSAAASSVLSQIYVWGVIPDTIVKIDHVSYLGRIIILLSITIAAWFVHRIYTRRLRENTQQTQMQQLLNTVSAAFNGINADNAHEKKRALIDEMAQFYGADMVFARPLNSEYTAYIPPLAYSTDGSELPEDYENIYTKRWQDWLDADGLQAINPDPLTCTEYTPDGPWLFIPIMFKNEPAGFIYFESKKTKTLWSREQRTALHIISRIISGALEKASGENRIRYMAYYDGLTGLPNRQLFHDRAEQAIHLARRNGRNVGIMFLDLDSFKSVNDTLGHEGGDMLIKAVGDKLTANLRKSDTVARFGGDEFLILFNSVSSLDEITTIADKIMRLFKDPIIVKDQELFITASAGISVFPVDGDDAQSLIKHADIAMYSAKEKGKNQYAQCSDNMKQLVQYRMTLSNQLYRALDNDEFELYYQPQVSLETGEIVGLEALLRWFHPQLGMVSPADFIPLAEQTGLINPIGNWVLKTACTQSVHWQQKGFGDIRMSVNLSVVQLRNSSLTGQVKQILDLTGMDPKLLELEVTESATTREPDYIVNVLNDLKKLGLSISIDDFGTEYSSLNRLKMLPIDRLKMDIQFVQGIDKSPKDQAITTVIINLAKNLDLKLIAEGVESRSQLDFLKQRMCDEVQGFFYYKPMPVSDIERLFRETNTRSASIS